MKKMCIFPTTMSPLVVAVAVSIFSIHLSSLVSIGQCSVLPSPSSPLADTTEDLIEKTCHLTPCYDLCISSLKSNPESATIANAAGLARIIIDTVSSNMTDTLSYIRDLIKKSAKGTALERPLAACAEIYGPVVKYYIPDAVQALAEGHPKFASYNIAQASKGADDCEKGFSGGSPSPITDKNKVVHDLATVATSILDSLSVSY